jgi:molecular chaperone Hsp33
MNYFLSLSLRIIFTGIYLAESEQRSCVLAAATSVTGVLCTAAGGYLIEQLPGVEQETIDKIEQNLARLVEMDGGDKLPTNLLSNGMSPLDIVEIILDGLDMAPLQQITPSAVCDCSEDRLFRSLRLLPKEDIADILEKEEMVEARCQFCGTVYRMGGDDLRTRLEEATGDPSKDSDNDYK